MHFTDYETMGMFQHPTKAVMLETYAGTAIVGWAGSIERQLIGMEDEYKSLKNQEYADKLHVFLHTWQDNVISGSMNVEVLQLLEAAAAQNAADPWKLANYFSNLRDSLRKLIAAQEELPVGDEPQPGNRRKSRSQPPGEFGPTAEPPPEGGAAGGAPPVTGVQVPT